MSFFTFLSISLTFFWICFPSTVLLVSLVSICSSSVSNSSSSSSIWKRSSSYSSSKKLSARDFTCAAARSTARLGIFRYRSTLSDFSRTLVFQYISSSAGQSLLSPIPFVEIYRSFPDTSVKITGIRCFSTILAPSSNAFSGFIPSLVCTNADAASILFRCWFNVSPSSSFDTSICIRYSLYACKMLAGIWFTATVSMPIQNSTSSLV